MSWENVDLPDSSLLFWDALGLVRCAKHRADKMELMSGQDVYALRRMLCRSGYTGSLCVPCESEAIKQRRTYPIELYRGVRSQKEKLS